MEPKRLGLIGREISYSLSPRIHLAAGRAIGLNIHYEKFDLAESEISSFIREFFAAGGLGLNVTKPYKQVVARLVDVADGPSVNTVFSHQGRLHGVTTDGDGFANALVRLSGDIQRISRLILLGSGGAALSIAAFYGKKHPDLPITVLRRSDRNDSLFMEALPHNALTFRPLGADQLSESLKGGAGEFDLLVQATSAPQHGDSLERLVEAVRDFRGLFVDLIYDRPSALLAFLRHNGNPCQDGLPMLIEQARLSQLHWFGRSADYDDIVQDVKSSRG